MFNTKYVQTYNPPILALKIHLLNYKTMSTITLNSNFISSKEADITMANGTVIPGRNLLKFAISTKELSTTSAGAEETAKMHDTINAIGVDKVFEALTEYKELAKLPLVNGNYKVGLTQFNAIIAGIEPAVKVK